MTTSAATLPTLTLRLESLFSAETASAYGLLHMVLLFLRRLKAVPTLGG